MDQQERRYKNSLGTLEETDLLQHSLRSAGIGLWEIIPAINSEFWDDRCKEMFGMAGEESMSFKQAKNHIHPEDADAVEEAFRNAERGSENRKIEIQFRAIGADGKLRFILFNGEVHRNASGEVDRLGGIAQDVTRFVAEHEQSKQSGDLAAAALESNNAGYFRLNLVTDEIDHSPVFAKLLTGDPTQKLSRTDVTLHVHPHDTLLRQSAYAEMVKTGKLFYAPRVVWTDGTLHRLRVTGSCTFRESGRPLVLTGIVQDISHEKDDATLQEEMEARFASIIDQAPLAMCLLRGPEMVIEVANHDMLSLWGKEQSIIGKPLMEALPEIKGQGFFETLEKVFYTGKHFYGTEVLAKLVRNGVFEDAYFNFVYAPLKDTNGQISGVIATATEVTRQVVTRIALEETESRFRSLIEEAPVATCLFVGSEMKIEVANDMMISYWGKDKSVLGKPLKSVLPELADISFFEILDDVFTNGRTYSEKAVPVKSQQSGIITTNYFDINCKPLRDAEGNVYAIIHMAIDVTPQVIARQKLEESEATLRSVIATAPAAIALFVGRELVIQLHNQAFVEIVGKGPDIKGKPLRQVMPELESQAFLEILDNVYTSGKRFQSFGSQVNIVQHGVMTHNFYNISYTPLFDSEGKVYAILDIGIDVTDSVKARQKLEETEASLRGAIEIAELATWTLDIETGSISYSDRMNEWVGITADMLDMKLGIPFISPNDRERVALEIENAIQQKNNGTLELEYGIEHMITGQKRIIHAQARTLFTSDGKPYKMIGTAQDITEQRTLQSTLEKLVHQRTKELQEVNQELEESNKRLIHSNEELAQYAYVASHDLQEPLRKIMLFSSMLASQEELPEKSSGVIMKISKSAARMSMLINNLLEFSRLLKTDVLMRPINLTEIATAVKDDFELMIQEKNAVIRIGKLPVIEAVSLQMNQLFYNLINNALKFSSTERLPEIIIEAKDLDRAEVHKYIEHPEAFRTYYCITVSDNGIGFDSKYADQIFEVFKRLHGRETYPGSGIGLAICRRIVANHNGYLFAKSTPGKGSTFYLILPDKQHDFKSSLPEAFTQNNQN